MTLPLGQWRGWLTDTLETEAPFIGIPDATYYFRVMATDNVNNASDWVEIGSIFILDLRFGQAPV